MNILLIDNGTKLLEQLKHLVSGHTVIHTWRDFTDVDVAHADLIILSGGSVMSLVGNETEFAREINLVTTTTKPVVGICFGCEVLTIAFGGTLRRLPQRHQGIREIELLATDDPSFSRRIKVYEGHRLIIDRMPEGFKVLGRSQDGPELIKHTSKPLLGFQFHPENFVEETDGHTIFNQLLAEIVRK